MLKKLCISKTFLLYGVFCIIIYVVVPLLMHNWAKQVTVNLTYSTRGEIMYQYDSKNKMQSGKSKADNPIINKNRVQTKSLFDSNCNRGNSEEKFEPLSNISFDDVRVHYQTNKPERLQTLSLNSVFVIQRKISIDGRDRETKELSRLVYTNLEVGNTTIDGKQIKAIIEEMDKKDWTFDSEQTFIDAVKERMSTPKEDKKSASEEKATMLPIPEVLPSPFSSPVKTQNGFIFMGYSGNPVYCTAPLKKRSIVNF